MATTTPSTSIYFLQNVPLRNDYENTILFDTPNEQQTFFRGKIRGELHKDDYSVVKILPPVIRTGWELETILDCNYIMFKNTGFGSGDSGKWIYAFITNVRYINNGCTEVTYQIDAWQTFMFDITINPCFVERHHVNNDDKWANKCPEPIGPTEYVYHQNQNITTIYPFGGLAENALAFILFSKYNLDSDPKEPTKALGYTAINGTGTANYAYYCGVTPDTVQATILRCMEFSDDAIAGIQLVPQSLCETLQVEGSYGRITSAGYVTYSDGETRNPLSAVFNHSDINGYVPRNYKCFNAPYYMMYVSNQQGKEVTFDFEDMSIKDNPTFRLYADINLGSSLVISPKFTYKGQSGLHDFDILLGVLPQAQYNSDNYNSYLLSQYNTVGNFLGATLGAATSLAQGVNPLSAAAGMINNTYSAVQSAWMNELRYQTTAPNSHNLSGASTQAVLMGAFNAVCGIKHIRRQDVERLDCFFDMYGYQVNTITSPNLKGRKLYNYVKTAGASVSGNCPSSYIDAIADSLNRGITLWHAGDKVGNYSLANRQANSLH